MTSRSGAPIPAETSSARRSRPRNSRIFPARGDLVGQGGTPNARLDLPADRRLHVSIFGGEQGIPRDDEAAALWKGMGVTADHIVALGRKDNFWGPAGGAGACGPCSEIYFDLGEKRPDYLPEGAFWGEKPGDDGDRYMEFWNNVFPQFDAQADGSLVPLARPGIDTGMGLERLALIMQGRNTIFETDLFEPLVEAVLGLSRQPAARGTESLRDARIIADHQTPCGRYWHSSRQRSSASRRRPGRRRS